MVNIMFYHQTLFWTSIIFLVNVQIIIGLNEISLRGLHLVVGKVDNPPYVRTYGDQDVRGYVPQILLYIAEKYCLTFEYVEQFSYGVLDANGTWNGMIRKLIDKEIDIGANGLLTYARSLVTDVTVPIASTNDDSSSGFLCPFPQIDSNGNSIVGIFKPFQYQVWIYIFLSLIACSSVLRFFAWIMNFKPNSFRNIFWFLLRMLLNARDDLSANFDLAGKLLTGFWCLMTLVLINAYSGSVTSYIMSPTFTPMVDSAEDIAALAPRPIVMADKSSILAASFLESMSTIGIKIGNTLKANPENLLQASPQLIEQIPDKINSNGGHCYVMVDPVMKEILKNDLIKTGKCRLYVAKGKWISLPMTMFLTKNNPMTSIINKEINWLREVGLLDAWRRQFWPPPNKCFNPTEKKNHDRNVIKSMSLDQIKGPFILLGVGMAISFFIFICEHIWNRIFSRKRIVVSETNALVYLLL